MVSRGNERREKREKETRMKEMDIEGKRTRGEYDRKRRERGDKRKMNEEKIELSV